LSEDNNGGIVTPYETRIEILADLWMNYRGDSEFDDFVEYNDLGLPLAYLLQNNIVTKTKQSDIFINETFELLVAAMETEDTGFENLDELMGFF
tara:strand:+ start:357 stop:638 length:282 start_codon:yes stop_codon:yes gene_type:complete